MLLANMLPAGPGIQTGDLGTSIHFIQRRRSTFLSVSDRQTSQQHDTKQQTENMADRDKLVFLAS